MGQIECRQLVSTGQDKEIDSPHPWTPEGTRPKNSFNLKGLFCILASRTLGNKFVFFEAIKCVVICYGASKKLWWEKRAQSEASPSYRSKHCVLLNTLENTKMSKIRLLEWSKTIKSKESEEETTKANKQWTWISQIQWHRSLEFHLSDRFLNQSRYRTQYALNISPWCQLGIREKEDGRPSVFPCYFRESSVVRTTQRDTKGLHAKEDPDKEIGCQNQTQTWRHVFRHSPTLTSQSSCYHPWEERDHKTSKKASAPGMSSRRKRLGLQGNARLTHLRPSFARTWLGLPITVPSKINISIYEFFLTLTTRNLKI